MSAVSLCIRCRRESRRAAICSVLPKLSTIVSCSRAISNSRCLRAGPWACFPGCWKIWSVCCTWVNMVFYLSAPSLALITLLSNILYTVYLYNLWCYIAICIIILTICIFKNNLLLFFPVTCYFIIILLLLFIIYYYYYYYLELVSSLKVFTKTAFSLGTHQNMKSRPFDYEKNTNICFVYVYVM